MEQVWESSMDDAFLKKLTDTVLNNLTNEQFGVEELSEQVGISRSQLHRKLKLLKGKSVSQFIREVRLEEAMKLLQNEVATASEIAYRVGFTSTSYFNTCFQSYYGYPPGEVKKLNKDRLETTRLNNYNNFPISSLNNLDIEKPYFKKQNLRLKLFGVVALIIIAAGGIVYYFAHVAHNPKTYEKSIAVLPFDNLSSDKENQYFADGIVEDLINRLSLINKFRIISRTSSEMYRKKGTKSVRQIGAELNVNYIIEGSVQTEGDKARINVQLIDAYNDDHIWSKLFDRDLHEIFHVQSEIAVQIASELNIILTAQETNNLQKNQTENIKAFELYQLGRFHWNRRTYEGFMTSIEYFEQAIAEDPNYGLAYAGMANTYYLLGLLGHMDENKGRDKAVALAHKALELDESLTEAHCVLGSIYTYFDFDWESAEKELRRALEINSNFSTAHQYYSEFLSIIDRQTQARVHLEEGLKLDPHSFIIRYTSGELYFSQGQFREALDEMNICLKISKDHPWPLHYSFMINYALGDNSAALRFLKRFGDVTGSFDSNKLDSINQTSGLSETVRWSIAESDKKEEKTTYYLYRIMEWYATIGDDEKVLDMLEKAFYDKKLYPEFTFEYPFKHLHNHPRFKALLDRMGLS